MGFAAEIKEFLGAAKDSWKLMSDTDYKDAQTKYTNVKAAAEQKEMDDPLNQKIKEANLAYKQASTANIGKPAALNPLQAYQLKLMQEAAANPPQGAAGIAQQPVNRPAIAAPAREDPDAIEGSGYRKGGLVRKFAVGGVVEDDDLAPAPAEDDDVLPPPAIGPTDVSAQSRAPQPAVGGVPMPRPKPNALTDGLKYGAEQLNRLPAIGSARSRAVQGYAQGAGGAPPDDMVKIYRKIDPNGEMGESERNLYALQAVHQYKTNMGDPEGAARAAFQMLQTYKTAATRYAAIAAVAMKEGHVDEGMKAAMKAYAQVPDGNDMKLYRGKDGRIGYEVTTKDADGKEKKVTGGLATPEEIGAAAMGLATPGGFENHLVQMASGAKIGGRATGGGKAKAADDEEGAPKPKDYGATKEQVGQHVDDWVAAEQKNNPKKEFKPDEITAVKNAMYHIRRNNDLTDDEALSAARTYLTAPEATKKGEKAPFKVIKDQDAGEATIRYPDGRELTLPMKDYLPLAGMRGKALADADAARKKADEDSKKETYTQMGGRAADAAVGTAKDVGETLAADPSVRAIGDLAKRVGVPSDLPGIPELARRGAAAIAPATVNPNLPPEYTEDRPL